MKINNNLYFYSYLDSKYTNYPGYLRLRLCQHIVALIKLCYFNGLSASQLVVYFPDQLHSKLIAHSPLKQLKQGLEAIKLPLCSYDSLNKSAKSQMKVLYSQLQLANTLSGVSRSWKLEPRCRPIQPIRVERGGQHLVPLAIRKGFWSATHTIENDDCRR